MLRGARRGAAAAINLGVEAARHPFVAQVDQDVVLGEGWLERLLEVLDDPEVAAAQGLYEAPPASPFWVRLASVDLGSAIDTTAEPPRSTWTTSAPATRSTADPR